MIKRRILAFLAVCIAIAGIIAVAKLYFAAKPLIPESAAAVEIPLIRTADGEITLSEEEQKELSDTIKAFRCKGTNKARSLDLSEGEIYIAMLFKDPNDQVIGSRALFLVPGEDGASFMRDTTAFPEWSTIIDGGALYERVREFVINPGRF